MSLGSHSLVIDGSSTMVLDTPVIAVSNPAMKATVTVSFGPQELTASEEGNGDMVVGTQTLSVGGPAITMDDHVLSDGPDGVVIDNLTTASWEQISEEEVRVTAADGKVLTAFEEPGHDGTVIVDGGVALSLGGPAATISGAVVSLGPEGLVVDSTVTEARSRAPITSSAYTKPIDQATDIKSNAGSTATINTTSGSMTIGVGGLGFVIVGSFYFFTTLFQHYC